MVIAIIAILAAILFPVFARAKAKARATQCLSNVKQLATAVKMYQSDWDDCYPVSLEDNTADTRTEWFFKIYSHNATYPTCADKRPEGNVSPYVGNTDILVCPDWTKDQLHHEFQSYGWNMGIATQYRRESDGSWTFLGPINDTSMTNPVAYMMIADLDTPYPYAYIYPRSWYWPLYYPSERHFGLCNAAYCDGHAHAGHIDEFWGCPKSIEQAHLVPPERYYDDTRYPCP